METTRIARAAVEHIVRYKRIPFVRQGLIICDEEHFTGWRLSDFLSGEEYNTQSVYVSIYKDGALRGRSGAVIPRYENLATHIIKASYGAANQDPSFNPVEESELPLLDYCVDLLAPRDGWISLSREQLDSFGPSATYQGQGASSQSPDASSQGKAASSPSPAHALYAEAGFRSAIILPEPGQTPPESPFQMFKKAMARANIQEDETPAIFLIPIKRQFQRHPD